MTSPQRPDAPRPVRGASSWARRVNADTVEWLAAYARLFSLLWGTATLLGLLGLIWWPSWHAAVSFVVMGAWAAGHGWLGFYVLANPEWRDDGEAR